MWPLTLPNPRGCSEPLSTTAQMVILAHWPEQSFLWEPLLTPWGPALDLINTKGEKAKWMFSQSPFSLGQLEVIKARGCFLVHKPVRVFGVMILLFNRLCFSLGQLIPQRDWWKPQYWFLCLSKPQLCSTLVRHLKEYPVGSGGNLRARLNRPALERSFCKVPSKPIEQNERERGKERGWKGWERKREGREEREEQWQREREERKEKRRKKGNFLLLIKILKDFHLCASPVSALPLLMKGHF